MSKALQILTAIALLIICSNADVKRAPLIRLHRLTRAEYNEFMRLSKSGEEMSEGRVIGSSIAGLTGLAAGLTTGLSASLLPTFFNLFTRATTTRDAYPVCMISTNESDEMAQADVENNEQRYHRQRRDSVHQNNRGPIIAWVDLESTENQQSGDNNLNEHNVNSNDQGNSTTGPRTYDLSLDQVLSNSVLDIIRGSNVQGIRADDGTIVNCVVVRRNGTTTVAADPTTEATATTTKPNNDQQETNSSPLPHLAAVPLIPLRRPLPLIPLPPPPNNYQQETNTSPLPHLAAVPLIPFRRPLPLIPYPPPPNNDQQETNSSLLPHLAAVPLIPSRRPLPLIPHPPPPNNDQQETNSSQLPHLAAVPLIPSRRPLPLIPYPPPPNNDQQETNSSLLPHLAAVPLIPSRRPLPLIPHPPPPLIPLTLANPLLPLPPPSSATSTYYTRLAYPIFPSYFIPRSYYPNYDYTLSTEGLNNEESRAVSAYEAYEPVIYPQTEYASNYPKVSHNYGLPYPAPIYIKTSQQFGRIVEQQNGRQQKVLQVEQHDVAPNETKTAES